MSIRDQEISRLVSYAEGMGVKVRFNNVSKDNSAEWTLDGSLITIFTKTNKSKTETILSLIHELGHHVWFIHEKNRLPDLKFEEAIERENLFAEDLATTPAPRKLRNKILRCEVAGTKYWEAIWKETNIKLPKWKLYAAMEYDVWQYEIYARTGHFPKGPFKRNKLREIRDRHKATVYE